MRYIEYLIEKALMTSTMVGYGVAGNSINNLYSTVKKILTKHNISATPSGPPHITIAQIPGMAYKEDLVDLMKDVDNTTFGIRSLKIFGGKQSSDDYIVIELKPTKEYYQAYNLIDNYYKTVRFGHGPRPHISLLKIKKGKLTPNAENELTQLNIKGSISPDSIELWNNRFKIEVDMPL